MLLALLIGFVGLICLIVLVRLIVQTLRYSEYRMKGENIAFFDTSTKCVRCETPVSVTTVRRTPKQVLFGGWSCPRCGSEFDQLGTIRVARSYDAHLRDIKRREEAFEFPTSNEDGLSPVQRLLDE